MFEGSPLKAYANVEAERLGSEIGSSEVKSGERSGLEPDGPGPDGLEPTDAGVDPVPVHDAVLVDDAADQSDPADLLID